MATLNHIQLEPKHFYIIEGLAKETSLPMEEVEKIYAEVFGELSSGARIPDYLIALTIKKVRDVLRQLRIINK